MAPLRLQLIASDPISRTLEYLNYLVFIFIVLFATAYSNFELGLIGLTSLMFMVIGRRWAGDAGVDRNAARLSNRDAGKIGQGAILALGAFLLVDAAVYPLYGFAGSVSSFFGGFLKLTVLPLSVSASVNVLVAVQNGISEEVFFRQAVTNYFVSRAVRGRVGVGGALVGIVMSGIVFGAAHIPVDGLDPVVITTLVLAGIIAAFAGLSTGLLSTCMIAHILNNLLATGLLFVFPATTGSALVIASTLAIYGTIILKSHVSFGVLLATIVKKGSKQ